MAPLTIHVGDDDEPLVVALRAVLRELNATIIDSSWGVGGSQEVVTYRVDVMGREVTIETETYMGCTLTGDADLVHMLAQRVHARMAAAGATPKFPGPS